jgi:hypothetical protein
VFDGTSVRGVLSATAVSTVVSCTGPVVFDDVLFGPPPLATAIAQGELHVTDSAHVSCRNSLLPLVSATNSNLALTASAIRSTGLATLGGLHVVSGTVWLQGGEVNGPIFYSFPIPFVAIRVDGGELVATGGAVIRRNWLPSTLPAIETTGGSLRLDPSVVVTGTPPVVGPATVVTAPVPSLDVATTANTLVVSAKGVAGNVLVTFAGLPSAPWASPWGTAWVLPTDPILDVAVLPPSGFRVFNHTVASVPAFTVLTVESVALDPVGNLVLGAPARFAWN